MKLIFKSNNEELQRELFRAMFSQLYDDKNMDQNSFYRLFRNKVLRAREIYMTDLSKLSDIDLLKFLNLNYTIELDINDYIGIYNEVNNKKYRYVDEIKTNAFSEVPVFFNKDDGFPSPWVLTPSQIGYKTLIDENVDFDLSKEYSIDYLKELIENKDIVILDEVYHEVVNKDIDINYIPSPALHKSNDSDLFQKKLINRVRTILTNKRQLEDLREYLLNYKKELDEFLSNMPYIQTQREIAEKISQMVNNSDEYSELQKMIKS